MRLLILVLILFYSMEIGNAARLPKVKRSYQSNHRHNVQDVNTRADGFEYGERSRYLRNCQNNQNCDNRQATTMLNSQTNHHDIDDPHAHLGGESQLPPTAQNINNIVRKSYVPQPEPKYHEIPNDVNNNYVPKGTPTIPPFYPALNDNEKPKVTTSHHLPTTLPKLTWHDFLNYPIYNLGYVNPEPIAYYGQYPYIVSNGHIHSPGCGHGRAPVPIEGFYVR